MAPKKQLVAFFFIIVVVIISKSPSNLPYLNCPSVHDSTRGLISKTLFARHSCSFELLIHICQEDRERLQEAAVVELPILFDKGKSD